MRKDRVSLDAKMMGPEPLFTDEDQEAIALEQENGKVGPIWSSATRWYNYFYDNKDYVPFAIDYLKDVEGWDDDKIKIFLRLPDWKIRRIGNMAIVWSRGYKFSAPLLESTAKIAADLFEEASLLEEQRIEAVKEKPKLPSIQERTRAKVLDTIYAEFDVLVVDQWMDGNYKVDFPAFSLFKNFGLKGNAITIFHSMIESGYLELKEAYDKTCPDCVEAYSHVTKGNKKKMLNVYESIFSDLDKLKDSFKATRKARVRVPKSNDKQVSKLNYMKEDLESKLTSIDPVLIPGKTKLWIYNTKQGKLTEFFTDNGSGFEVVGSTLKNFDPKLSKVTKLRKPEQILPKILNKTEFQIKKIWKELTTKIYEPTGRINKDCILMRVI
jgi:protein-arginine kinase activator protein McsA